MAERSKALVSGTSLRAWVRTPLSSYTFLFLVIIKFGFQLIYAEIPQVTSCITRVDAMNTVKFAYFSFLRSVRFITLKKNGEYASDRYLAVI